MRQRLINQGIAFPKTLPKGYQYLEDEPTYNPSIHLALERPTESLSLRDFGYSDVEIAKCPTDYGISGIARLLSDEGVTALMNVAQQLRRHTTGGERIQYMLRGGVYRSRFLRDLCLCPKVTAFISEIYGIEIAPHSIPLHLGHCNYAPDDLDRAVDKWHSDTLGLDYVLMVSDPREQVGGEFQYFLGTKAEVEEIMRNGQEMPEDRIISPNFPGPGYMIVMQGGMIVHRGAKLKEAYDRITMVNGYVPLDTISSDPSRFSDIKAVDPHDVLFPEWARHKAWLARGRLDRLIDELPFTQDREYIIGELKSAIQEVEVAIKDLSDETPGASKNYGDL